jgi:hypothetical protein
LLFLGRLLKEFLNILGGNGTSFFSDTGKSRFKAIFETIDYFEAHYGLLSWGIRFQGF